MRNTKTITHGEDELVRPCAVSRAEVYFPLVLYLVIAIAESLIGSSYYRASIIGDKHQTHNVRAYIQSEALKHSTVTSDQEAKEADEKDEATGGDEENPRQACGTAWAEVAYATYAAMLLWYRLRIASPMQLY